MKQGILNLWKKRGTFSDANYDPGKDLSLIQKFWNLTFVIRPMHGNYRLPSNTGSIEKLCTIH